MILHILVTMNTWDVYSDVSISSDNTSIYFVLHGIYDVFGSASVSASIYINQSSSVTAQQNTSEESTFYITSSSVSSTLFG